MVGVVDGGVVAGGVDAGAANGLVGVVFAAEFAGVELAPHPNKAAVASTTAANNAMRRVFDILQAPVRSDLLRVAMYCRTSAVSLMVPAIASS